ncbi:MAG: NADPH-dependent glutamate synthase [Mailhella sp.]|nr:NADPH-dependent glutamate synthase [Mailhella sp.]
MSQAVTQGAKIARHEMPCQDPRERIHNFNEVALGYTAEMAHAEATRCLQCKKPLCRSGCPVDIAIPEFIRQVVLGDIDEASRIIHTASSLPAVCGRVCPQEKQCEGKCILGKKGSPVAIGRLERFVADHASAEKTPEIRRVGRRVACIGSGPSSVTCAGYLARLGVDVTVFEGLHEAGGVLIYGIPAFRLPKDVVARELDSLRAMGVDIRLNYVGGRTVTVQGLLDEGYDAVFLGVGAGLPYFLNVANENAIGVFSANEYLTRVNLGRAHSFPDYDTPVCPGKHVTVFGAGNVAMDAARTALRLGAESVHVVYRRTRAEMPARGEEIEHALEEGMQLLELSAPLNFITDENSQLTGVRLQRMELGEPDASGRRRPRPVPGSEFEIETDLAIVALGTRPNPLLLGATPELDLNEKGYIKVDENGETSIPNVYAGGDIVTGAATVILAMGAGRRAAQSIAKKLGIEE